MPKTKTSEYLVVARGGKMLNFGPAANVILRPGTIYIKMPAAQLETFFAMAQETRDGITMRFKGSTVFRIIHPEVAAQRFDFSTPESGVAAMAAMIQSAALAELRDTVSHLTMEECIEQRKTTLTGAVTKALEHLTQHPERAWGIELISVLVAQVFIGDQDLQRALEAETRSRIQANADLSKLAAEKSVSLQRIVVERDIQKETQESGLQEIQLGQEIASQKALAELARLASVQPVALRQVNDEIDLQERKRELLARELENHRLEVARDLLLEQAKHAMRMEALPVEQQPAIASALGGLFQGSRLSVYGSDSTLLAGLEPLIDLVAAALRPQAGSAVEEES